MNFQFIHAHWLLLLPLDLLQLRRDDAHGGLERSRSRHELRRVIPSSVLLRTAQLACHQMRPSQLHPRPSQLRPSSPSGARALLMKLLGRAGALSQRARFGALRFPLLPLVRRLGAKICHHRMSLRRLPLPSQD